MAHWSASLQPWLWPCSIAIQLVVFGLLLRGQRFRRLPAFSAYVSVNLCEAFFLFVVYKRFGFGSHTADRLAWIADGITTVPRVLATLEIFRLVLRPYRGVWALAWRLLAASFATVLCYAALDAGRNLPWAMMIADRGFHFALAISCAVCLLLVRYYSIPLDRLFKTFLAGFCFFFCATLLKDTALLRIAYRFPSQQPCPIERPQFGQDILGSAIASFGIGELWILIARVWRLVFHREQCAPLLSRNRWELDATSWVYLVAMILALIPFVVGSSLVIPKLYLYGPSFIMGFLGILMIITIDVPFRLPIGINSQARGSRLRPFIYYAAEDFIAVDGLQDREFRVRYNERYESNRMFRRFFRYLTLWWLLGVCLYIGCVSAVIWTLPFHYAFGLSLGVLFAYIAVWAAATYVWTTIEMKREHRAYEEGRINV